MDVIHDGIIINNNINNEPEINNNSIVYIKPVNEINKIIEINIDVVIY